MGAEVLGGECDETFCSGCCGHCSCSEVSSWLVKSWHEGQGWWGEQKSDLAIVFPVVFSPHHFVFLLSRLLPKCVFFSFFFFLIWFYRDWAFPGSSAGKESTYNAGDPGSIPGLGRSPGEGIDYTLQYSGSSLVAQMVNPPAMQETWVQSLGWEDPL